MNKNKLVMTLLIGAMMVNTGGVLAYGTENKGKEGNIEAFNEVKSDEEKTEVKDGARVAIPKFLYVNKNSVIGTVKDSQDVSQKITNIGATVVKGSKNTITVKVLIESKELEGKDYKVEFDFYGKKSLDQQDGEIKKVYSTKGTKKKEIIFEGIDAEQYKKEKYLNFRVKFVPNDSEKPWIKKEIYYKIDNPAFKEFTDISGHFAEQQILSLYSAGHINGYSDNTFKPNKSITRAEFIKLTNRVFRYENYKNVEKFKDVSSKDWYFNEINAALNAGYITSKNATFSPNEPITREEAANIITSIQKCKDSNLDKLNKYADKNQVSNWAKSSVEGAIEEGFMGQSSNNRFRPKDNLTRGEAVVVLDKAVKYGLNYPCAE